MVPQKKAAMERDGKTEQRKDLKARKKACTRSRSCDRGGVVGGTCPRGHVISLS